MQCFKKCLFYLQRKHPSWHLKKETWLSLIPPAVVRPSWTQDGAKGRILAPRREGISQQSVCMCCQRSSNLPRRSWLVVKVYFRKLIRVVNWVARSSWIAEIGVRRLHSIDMNRCWEMSLMVQVMWHDYTQTTYHKQHWQLDKEQKHTVQISITK